MIGPTQFADYIAAFNCDDVAGYSKYYDKTFCSRGVAAIWWGAMPSSNTTVQLTSGYARRSRSSAPILVRMDLRPIWKPSFTSWKIGPISLQGR